ncbi:MAG: aliphatic sulfonate ABC transporter ATP-binding protein, partial [Burkholderiales bacterium]|nr:aliphatic sulfonate ABC transporter ATP-binding protein [Burkholderiales bacterium]
GMAQRVGLARGIISKPDLLLLDEPFSSLDYMTRTKLQMDFSNMESELSMTMLMITHDINEAVFLSNKVVYLEDGKVAKKMEIDVPMPRKLGDPKLQAYQNELLDYILRNQS